jgi:hypothetical protein
MYKLSGESTPSSPSPYEKKLELPPFPEITEEYLPANANIHFHLSPHSTAEQFDEAAVLFKDANIFIPEAVGWDAKELRDVNAISKGDRKLLERRIASAKDYVHGEYNIELYRALIGSRKPVTFIDIDSTQSEFKVGNFRQHYRMTIGKDIETTLDNLADFMFTIAEKSSMRDRIMVDRLGANISKIVQSNPRLQSKEFVNVLCTLGFTHTQPVSYLEAHPFTTNKVTSSLWSPIKEYDPESKIVKKYKDDEAPTQADLHELLIAFALSSTRVPGLPGVDQLYDFGRLYTRSTHPSVIFGSKLLEVMTEETDVTVPLAFDILAQRNLSVITNALRDYSLEAIGRLQVDSN